MELDSLPLYSLPYVNPYLWRISHCWLNEFTYEKWGSWNRILKNTYKMKKEKISLLNSSGLWLEKFKAEDYLERLKKITKSSSTDGYWLYPQMRMSKNCYWRLYPNDPWSISSLAGLPYHSFIDANKPESDPDFFIKLKDLNSNIDNYRSGLWFNIRKLISNFFR